MKCAELSPVPLHSVHWRRKGSLREQSTLLPDHTASLGHKRDFSLAPQKETNGTRKNSFPPKVLPGSEPVAWEGLDGCLSTGCHIWLIAQDRTRLLELFIISAKEDLTGRKKTPLHTFASKCSPTFYSSTAFVSSRALLSSLYKSGSGICICPGRRYTISRLSWHSERWAGRTCPWSERWASSHLCRWPPQVWVQLGGGRCTVYWSQAGS